MSLSDSESGIAFEVSFGESPKEGSTKPPELPHHLQVRLQTYDNSRSRKSINDRLEEAERRRQRHMARRAENARQAEERCRRIAEAMEIVTDYNRHVRGKQVLGNSPPCRDEVKAVFANVKEDLQVVLGRVDREARRMVDRSYVHEPTTYRPQRRATHTEHCTCECCYLEDTEKMARVQQELTDILAGVSNTSWHANSLAAPGRNSAGRRCVSWADERVGDARQRTQTNRASHVDLALGPDCSVQTEEVCCPDCEAVQSLRGVIRATQTAVEKHDVACQTEPEQFACHCCSRQL